MKKKANIIKYTIYKTTNRINNKIYVGKHIISDENDVYFGSGYLLKRAINKYGIENFNKEIIEYCQSEEELALREIYWINELKSLMPLGYNMTPGGTGGDTISSNPRKAEICKNISDKLKGIVRGPESVEHKLKNRNTHLGKKDSKETKMLKAKAQAKSWILISPFGSIISTFETSLKAYCKKNKLSYNLLLKYKNSTIPNDLRIKHTKGWSLYEKKKKEISK